MVLTDVWKRLKAAFVSCSDGIAVVETVSSIIFGHNSKQFPNTKSTDYRHRLDPPRISLNKGDFEQFLPY